jgi:Uma2 family endonuclease
MAVTSPEELHMTQFRRTAEAAEKATGLRAEIIRGVLMMSPSPSGKHAGIINKLLRQLLPFLPEHLEPFHNASLALPHDPDDYATPDLLVGDAAFEESDDWLAEPGSVEVVVEVVSKSNSTKDTREMVGWYAEAGVPAYLLIDPRRSRGTWTLYTVPHDGTYRAVRHGDFGEDIELPNLGVKLTTGDFPRYD